MRYSPGSEQYDTTTAPHNASGRQRPAYVLRPESAAEVADAVRDAARDGHILVPQATGHGAAGDLADDTVIVDTSGLNEIVIDGDNRVGLVGAGATWGAVNARAERHGLLGLAGSAPSVSVSGYTFGGGIGWLVRRHGTAAAALRAVDYVDGRGEIRRATEDAPDEIDREALFAFRGGGGVGIATRLEFDLFPVADLHAGHLLWPVDALDEVVAAWLAQLASLSPDVATSIGVLRIPPQDPFPPALRGQVAVHLAVADIGGQAAAAPLLEAVTAAADPVQNSWGPADAARLGQIHLDPPGATPAIGAARWLSSAAPDLAATLLSTAAQPNSGLVMAEIRHVGGAPARRPGAQTDVVGPFVWHAVGPVPPGTSRADVDAGLSRLREVAEPADLGRDLGSWMEGQTGSPEALTGDVRARVAAVADAVDPDHRISRPRQIRTA